MSEKISIVWEPGPNQGPEPVTLAHGITMIPGRAIEADPDWAEELAKSYPQIKGADAQSRRRLRDRLKQES